MCPVCEQYVGTFDKEKDKILKCNVCDIEINVRDPTYTNFFVIIDPSFELSHLIEQNYEHTKY